MSRPLVVFNANLARQIAPDEDEVDRMVEDIAKIARDADFDFKVTDEPPVAFDTVVTVRVAGPGRFERMRERVARWLGLR